MSSRTSVSRRTLLLGAGTMGLAACTTGAGSMLGAPRGTSAARHMTMSVNRNAGARARALSSVTASTTTAGPGGSSVHVADGLFSGYDASGAFVAQVDTSTEDDYGMPIMKVVTSDGTSATVNFPDISTISPGVPWAFTFQGDSYQLLLSPTAAGNVQMFGPGGTTTTISNNGGDRTITDSHGQSFTLAGTEIDRMGSTIFATTSTSTTASNTRTTRQAVAQPVDGGGGGAPPFPPNPGPPTTCTPQQITNCENLRDAIFALFVLALAAIVLITIGCVLAAWFAAAICTVVAAAALALATAMMLRSVRLFNFGVCCKVCHVYA